MSIETTPVEEKKWYSLRVISGKEKKIKERIDLEVSRSTWKEFIFSVIVPTEKVYKIRNGKKVVQERNLLPGYILIEAYGSKLNGDVAKMIADIPNVIHFLGKEQPLPMTTPEAHRLLGIVDENTETGESMVEPYLIGETVKIIDGPFTDFVGDVQKVDEEKKKLTVIVKIFGRGTEVELSFMQVEKIS
ncbi:MAG: transcription termination/antitermination protein NusG [Saprospiraceae bacterium]